MRWQGLLDDGAAALAFLSRREASRPLVIAGHSSGAYMAAMLALDQDRRSTAGVPACSVVGAIGLAGPYDFLPLDAPDLFQVFGPGRAGPETQPVTFAGPGDPPMLLAIGTADTTVKPANTASLAEHLERVGMLVVVRRYPGIGHIGLVASLAASLRFLGPTLDDIDSFIKGLPPVSGSRRCE